MNSVRPKTPPKSKPLDGAPLPAKPSGFRDRLSSFNQKRPSLRQAFSRGSSKSVQLPIRDKKDPTGTGKAIQQNGKPQPNRNIGNARAGPSNAMNVIDLTSEDEDDQGSEDYVSAFGGDEVGDSGFMNHNNGPLPRVDGQRQQSPAPAPAAHQQVNSFGAGDFWGDYVLDEEFDDENVARAFAYRGPESPALSPPPVQPHPHRAGPVVDLEQQAPAQPAQPTPGLLETRDECIANVLVIFPDICPTNVSTIFDTVAPSSSGIIAHILDKMEKGSPYPKAKDKQKTLKRKREVDEDEAAVLKYSAPNRQGPLDLESRNYM